MKKPGIYMTKKHGIIWLIEEIEYFQKSVAQDGEAFSIAIKGFVDGNKAVSLCLIRQSQFKQFVFIGEL